MSAQRWFLKVGSFSGGWGMIVILNFWFLSLSIYPFPILIPNENDSYPKDRITLEHALVESFYSRECSSHGHYQKIPHWTMLWSCEIDMESRWFASYFRGHFPLLMLVCWRLKKWPPKRFRTAIDDDSNRISPNSAKFGIFSGILQPSSLLYEAGIWIIWIFPPWFPFRPWGNTRVSGVVVELLLWF